MLLSRNELFMFSVRPLANLQEKCPPNKLFIESPESKSILTNKNNKLLVFKSLQQNHLSECVQQNDFCRRIHTFGSCNHVLCCAKLGSSENRSLWWAMGAARRGVVACGSYIQLGCGHPQISWFRTLLVFFLGIVSGFILCLCLLLFGF